jgi:hypothetical protein
MRFFERGKARICRLLPVFDEHPDAVATVAGCDRNGARSVKDECIMDAQQQQQQQPANAPLPPEPDYDQYFERVTRVAARALNLPISVVCLDRLGQPEVIGACGCERDVVSHVETYYYRTLQCEEPFVVRDALSDAKPAQRPLATGESEIRFFAGIALRLPCGNPLACYA